MPALDFTTFQAKTTPAPAAAPPSASSRAARGGKGASGAGTPHEPFGRLVDRLTDAEADASTPDARQDRLRGRASHDTRAAHEHQSDESRTRSAGEESNAASTSGETTGSMTPAATQPAFPWTLPLDPVLWNLAATGSGSPDNGAAAGTTGVDGGADAIGAASPEAATDPSAGVATSSPAMTGAVFSVPGTGGAVPATASLTNESTTASAGAGAVHATGDAPQSADHAAGRIAGDVQGASAAGAAGAAGMEASQRPGSTSSSDPTSSTSAIETIDGGAHRTPSPISPAASGPSTGASSHIYVHRAAGSPAGGDPLATDTSSRSGNGATQDPANADGTAGPDADGLAAVDPNGRAILDDSARRQAKHELLRAIDGPTTDGRTNSGRAENGGVNGAVNGAASQGVPNDAAAVETGETGSAGTGTGLTSGVAANQRDGASRAGSSDKSAANAGAANEHTFTSGDHGFGAAGGDSAGERGSGFGGRFGRDPRDPAGTALSSSRGAADSIGSGSTSAADFRALSAALAAQGLGGTSGSAGDAALPGAGYGDVPIDTGAPAAEQAAQIVRAMRLQWRGTVGEATLRLQPEHLGQVLVNVRVEQGVVSATVHAETPAAQQWIQAHQQQLRDALDAQGLRVAQFHVTSNPDDRPRRDQPQQESSDRRGHTKRRHDPDDETAPRFEIRV